MSHTSKSPREVARVALAVAKGALPEFAHRFSPKKFTQPQLFGCLVLKEFFRTDYRGIVQVLRDLPDLCQVLGLKAVPHFTTLQKAAQRLLRKAPANRLLEETIRRWLHGERPADRAGLAALDSTGFEAHHASRYFVERRAKGLKGPLSSTFKSYPKLGVLCDCASHVILAAVPDQAPRNDIRHFTEALRQAHRRAPLHTLLADAAYDAEWVHQLARTELGVSTLIPPDRGHPTDRPARGQYRRLMQQTIHLSAYGQRWQVETVMSMIKRRLGDTVGACSYWCQCRAMMLKAVTHNILILLCEFRGFLQSKCSELRLSHAGSFECFPQGGAGLIAIRNGRRMVAGLVYRQGLVYSPVGRHLLLACGLGKGQKKHERGSRTPRESHFLAPIPDLVGADM